MASEKYVSRFLADMDSLEQRYPGIASDMAKCADRQMAARGAAYAAYTTTEVSAEDQEKIDKLKTLVDSMSALDMPTDALQEKITAIRGGLHNAIQAYESAMSTRPSGKADSAKSSRTSLHGVYLFPFKADNVSYVGVFTQGSERELYRVIDIQENKFERMDVPEYLSGFKVRSPTAARKWAWAMHHDDIPSNCHDGTGKNGELAALQSDDPVQWASEHLDKGKGKD